MKKRVNVTLEDIARWRKQGLGLGEGKVYRPWLSVRDVPSLGRKSRVKSITVGRVHHLLSDHETRFLMWADYARDVVDIREQFPLFPHEETQSIAEQMGVRHPCYPHSQTPVVITTDFLLTLQGKDGSRLLRAYSVKPSVALASSPRKRRRILEKLDIEECFWRTRGVPWQLVTEKQFDLQVTRNLRFLHYLALNTSPQLVARAPEFLGVFARLAEREETMHSLLTQCAFAMPGASFQAVDQIFRYCAWHQLIELDLSQPLKLKAPLVIRSVQRAPSLQALAA